MGLSSRLGSCSPHGGKMVVGSGGGHWKRPINRMYSYNYQVGESYYLPMTSYLDSKSVNASKLGVPGPLSFSERIAVNALNDTMLKMTTSSLSSTRTVHQETTASL